MLQHRSIIKSYIAVLCCPHSLPLSFVTQHYLVRVRQPGAELGNQISQLNLLVRRDDNHVL